MFDHSANDLNGQRAHWEHCYTTMPEMFGVEPSKPACAAIRLFQQKGVQRILELGAGQGRDTLYFAGKGFAVEALDYAPTGLAAINAKAATKGLTEKITTTQHDVRSPLPFDDNSLDACYAHMLFCMALSPEEVTFVFQEVRRVLKPGGLCVYTVRHTQDPHFGIGVPCGHNMYDVDGFIVHFFNRKTVEQQAEGFTLLYISPFEEGELPRKLFRVALQKP